VREVGGDTGGVDDIVERELADQRARLHEKGQRLANATRGSCDNYRRYTMSAPDSLIHKPRVPELCLLTNFDHICGVCEVEKKV